MAACVALRADQQEQGKAGQKQGMDSMFHPSGLFSAETALSRTKALLSPEELPNCEESVLPIDEKQGEEEAEHHPGQFDIWKSIMSKNKEEETSPLPYVHPLVRRASSLSEKSLEICTENLGSETGSDGFSSDSNSNNNSDGEEHCCYHKKEVKVDTHQQYHDQEHPRSSSFLERYAEDVKVVKYKKSPPRRPLPPPLPSLSHHMKSRRENGRVVLDAVSPSSQNRLHADRHEGRLVLSFVEDDRDDGGDDNKNKKKCGIEDQIEEEEEKEEKFEEGEDAKSEEDEEEAEEVVEMGIVAEQSAKPLSGGLISVHRSAIPMKKLMRLANTNNPTWPTKFNEVVVDFDDDDGDDEETKKAANYPAKTARAKSLPPRPKVARLIPTPPAVAAATSFSNAYEYCWRSKAAPTKAVSASLAQQPPPQKGDNSIRLIARNTSLREDGNSKPELLLLRGSNGYRYRAEYFVPLLRGGGCKEEPAAARRSILIWEPYYGIATS